MAFMNELESAIHSHGFHLQGSINYQSTKIQRFKSANKARSGKDLFVALHDMRGATFGDWHDRDGWITWWLDSYSRPSIQDLAERRELKREIDRRRQEIREHAIKRAKLLWDKFPMTDGMNHAYVLKKRIRAYYARHIKHDRWIKNTLLIPIRNIHYEFIGLQVIKANGFKRFWKGTAPSGNMIWLSPFLPPNFKDFIYICEGYSTGCSIYEAIGAPVICAVNAYNLIKVTELLNKQYPLATLVICADNDEWTKDNPGIKYAIDAMRLTGAIMRRPVFTQFDMSGKPTDFNDLLCLAGIEEVENQLMKQQR